MSHTAVGSCLKLWDRFPRRLAILAIVVPAITLITDALRLARGTSVPSGFFHHGHFIPWLLKLCRRRDSLLPQQRRRPGSPLLNHFTFHAKSRLQIGTRRVRL